MGSIPAISYVQNVLLLLWHVRFNELAFLKCNTIKKVNKALNRYQSAIATSKLNFTYNGIPWYEKEITGHSILWISFPYNYMNLNLNFEKYCKYSTNVVWDIFIQYEISFASVITLQNSIPKSKININLRIFKYQNSVVYVGSCSCACPLWLYIMIMQDINPNVNTVSMTLLLVHLDLLFSFQNSEVISSKHSLPRKSITEHNTHRLCKKNDAKCLSKQRTCIVFCVIIYCVLNWMEQCSLLIFLFLGHTPCFIFFQLKQSVFGIDPKIIFYSYVN